MENILEHFQQKFENSELAKGIFLGTPEKELRFIGNFGNISNKKINKIDLAEIDKDMDYNGDHSFLMSNPDFFI